MNRLLAQDYEVVSRSPDPANIWLGSPSLTVLPSGRLVATYQTFCRSKDANEHLTYVCISDDHGQTWQKTAEELKIIWATVFVIGERLWLIGVHHYNRDIVITFCDDGGYAWTPISTLFEGFYSGAPTPVVRRGNTIYHAFETCVGIRTEWKSLVVAGDLSKDLARPEAWRMSNHVPFPGVPSVLTQSRYPELTDDDSWLEGNVVLIDNKLRVHLRSIIDGHTTAGIMPVCSLDDDGQTMDYRFDVFYPVPGAQGKFFIVHDKAGGLFWTAVNLPADVWQDPRPLVDAGFKPAPGDERRVLVLQFSVNALNWFPAGYIAIAPSMLESFSYPSLLIDGNDLLVLARSGIGDNENQHDTNLITFHRVRNFRSLVPPTFMSTIRLKD
jgi:hypothetical protein